MISISTAWNVARHANAKNMVKEITSMGFKTMELNFTITKKMLIDIDKLVKEGKIKVVSLHNFCPIPDNLDIEQASPDYYSLSSTDETERKFAVKYTKNTIDSAALLGTSAVVVHAGYIDTKERIRSLAGLYEMGKKGTDEYNNYIKLMRVERDLNKQKHLDCLLKSLEEVNDHAEKKQVKIGIENRFYFREIPSLDEIGIILDRFPDSNIYYWHDVGHAQVSENLGLVSHIDFLNRYNKRLIGIHLHNVKGANDHRAILDGDFDFSILKPFIKKGILLVIESHFPATKKDMMQGRDYLENLFAKEVSND